MTLVETAVALALMLVIGGALVSFAVGGLSLSNSSNIRAAATRLAEEKMELIKSTEHNNKMAIQTGDFSSLISSTDHPGFGSNATFFTRTVTVTSVGTPPDRVIVAVCVYWDEKGRIGNCASGMNAVKLSTYITKWE